MKTKINDRIKELRTSLALSQTEFAYQTGISHSLLTKIEAGDNPPTQKVLNKIIEKWNIDSEWLNTGKGEITFSEKVAIQDWKDEAWKLANDQLSKKDQTIEMLSTSFERLTKFLDRVEGSFLHPVGKTG